PRAHLAALKRADIPAAALLAAWLFATVALDAIEWARLSRTASAAEEEMRALLLKSFPETRAILDPAEQMRRGLEDLGAGSGIAAPGDMLFLLARAAPVIERESRVRTQGIEYAGRALLIRLAASEADAESIARALRARSLDVEVQRAGGEARLRVRAARQYCRSGRAGSRAAGPARAAEARRCGGCERGARADRRRPVRGFDGMAGRAAAAGRPACGKRDARKGRQSRHRERAAAVAGA